MSKWTETDDLLKVFETPRYPGKKGQSMDNTDEAMVAFVADHEAAAETRLFQDIFKQPVQFAQSLSHLFGPGKRCLEAAAEVMRKSGPILISGIGASWHAGMAMQAHLLALRLRRLADRRFGTASLRARSRRVRPLSCSRAAARALRLFNSSRSAVHGLRPSFRSPIKPIVPSHKVLILFCIQASTSIMQSR